MNLEFPRPATLVLVLAACGGPTAPVLGGDAGPVDAPGPMADAPAPAFDLVRVAPAHGPFGGGNRALLRGAGFRSSNVTVRFGDALVAGENVRRIDPSRLEVLVPPGAPGLVDVAIEQDGERADLIGGYTYDAVALAPDHGPSSGRTRVTIRSATDAFGLGTTVTFGGSPCTDLEVTSPRELVCRTPAHALGAVDVVIGGGAPITLADAFTYDNPFRSSGGLSGGPIDGTLTILVRDPDQRPLPGALVVAGREGELDLRARSDANGSVTFSGPDVRAPMTVIAFHPCYHSNGFVGFDASFVTAQLRLAYLDCVRGGGAGGSFVGEGPVGDLEGEVTFFEGVEFPSPTFDWEGVPEAGPGRVRAIYVAAATARDLLNGDGTSAAVSRTVRLDASSGAGARGLRFHLDRIAANGAAIVFAVAGVEPDDDQGGDGSIHPEFEPAVVGLATAVVPRPNDVLGGIEVAMDTPLGAGRSVRAEAIAAPPALGVPTFTSGVTGAELDELRVFVRYAAPGLVGGLPLFFGDGSLPFDEIIGPPGAPIGLVHQPEPRGSFALAEQELFVVHTTSGGDRAGFYDLPHTRTLVRAPLDRATVEATEFLAIPDVDGATVEPNGVVHWGFDGPSPTYFRVRLEPISFALFTPLVDLFVRGDARAVTLPDVSAERDVAPFFNGLRTLEVSAYDISGISFDEIDIRSSDSLPIRRSSANFAALDVAALSTIGGAP